ncbi:MAG: hypothetical protein HQM00_05745 [Magnetococcales bacterium]|nr:hypothetical protein [Magnetococcales bacterium]
MAIINTDLTVRKSVTVNDTTSNGGKMGLAASVVTTGSKNNVWPDIPEAERVAGSTRWRKLFIRIAPAVTTLASETRVFLEKHTPGDDTIVLAWAGNRNDSQTDTQAEADDYTTFFGGGDLDANASAGASSITVEVEPGNASSGHAIFHNGDLIRISNKASQSAETGTEEFLRLHASTGVSWSGNVATLTFASGVTLENAYTTSEGTRVQSVIEVGDVQPTITGWTESGSGTFNEATYPVTGSSKGTVEDTWTLTFTSATAFTVTGAATGSVGSGNISGDFSPTNTDASAPYFTISLLGWGGTWTTGDTVSWSTHPSAFGIWLKRVVPAGAASTSADTATLAMACQSA